MPPSVVKNKEDERLWDKAKDIAAEAGKKEEYDYVMGIFKKMNPDRFASLSPAFKLALRYASEEPWDWKPAARWVEDWINDSFSELPTDVWMNLNPKGEPVLNFRMDYKSRYSEKWSHGKFRALRNQLSRKFGLTPSPVDESSYTLPSGQKVTIQMFIGGIPSGERLAFDQTRGDFMSKVEKAADTSWATALAKKLAAEFPSKTAAEPPMHMAAKADEALGEAYNSLVALKLGFDTWTEIPQSTLPLYNWIGKAIAQVVTARQSTHQVREMVRQKKY